MVDRFLRNFHFVELQETKCKWESLAEKVYYTKASSTEFESFLEKDLTRLIELCKMLEVTSQVLCAKSLQLTSSDNVRRIEYQYLKVLRITLWYWGYAFDYNLKTYLKKNHKHFNAYQKRSRTIPLSLANFSASSSKPCWYQDSL